MLASPPYLTQTALFVRLVVREHEKLTVQTFNVPFLG